MFLNSWIKYIISALMVALFISCNEAEHNSVESKSCNSQKLNNSKNSQQNPINQETEKTISKEDVKKIEGHLLTARLQTSLRWYNAIKISEYNKGKFLDDTVDRIKICGHFLDAIKTIDWMEYSNIDIFNQTVDLEDGETGYREKTTIYNAQFQLKIAYEDYCGDEKYTIGEFIDLSEK